MAANLSTACGSTSSPPDILDVARLPRQLFRIHKSQQELLDKADAWVQNLARQPKPGVHLPAEVLENLRNFYRKEKNRPLMLDTVSPNTKPGAIEGHFDDAESVSSQSLRNGVDLEAEDEDVASQIPWSSSPVRREGENAGDDVDATPSITWPPSHVPPTREEPMEICHPSRTLSTDHDHEDSVVAQPQQFRSQISMKSPLQPTMGATNTRSRPIITEFPSSSLSVDEELEMVPPGVLQEEVTVAKKTVELNPTPPSAQVQVPCSFETDSSTSARPFKELASLQTVQQRLAAKPTVTATKPMQLAQSIDGYNNDIPDSQSSVESASSVIPATILRRDKKSPVKSLRGQLIKSTVAETPLRRTTSLLPPIGSSPGGPQDIKDATANDEIGRKTPEYRPGSPDLSYHPSPKPDQNLGIGGTLSSVASTITASSPFLQYCLAYPDYKGSVKSFASACKSIPDKRLANYQYDDFIRAWQEGFVPYIHDGGKLVAIEWYLDSADDLPLSFQKRIVTKKNLEEVLAFHSADLPSKEELEAMDTRQTEPTLKLPPPHRTQQSNALHVASLSENHTKNLSVRERGRRIEEPAGHSTHESVRQPLVQDAIDLENEALLESDSKQRRSPSIASHKRGSDVQSSEFAVKRTCRGTEHTSNTSSYRAVSTDTSLSVASGSPATLNRSVAFGSSGKGLSDERREHARRWRDRRLKKKKKEEEERQGKQAETS